MHINGIIITKHFISHWNSKCLRGSVGRAHIHIDYIFLKSNSKPKIKAIFIINIICCLVYCVILQFIHISQLSKSLGFIPWLSRREDQLLLHLHLHGYTPPSIMTSVARVVAS